jgi:hypothetical protein
MFIGVLVIKGGGGHDQGCQIFVGPKYQNVEKYTKLPQNIPNVHKIFLPKLGFLV